MFKKKVMANFMKIKNYNCYQDKQIATNSLDKDLSSHLELILVIYNLIKCQ